MNKTIGEALIAEKKVAIPKVRSKIMKEYWQKKRDGWVDVLKANLQQQVTKYASRYYAYKNNMPEQPTKKQHALLDQHRYNYNEAQRVRKDLMEQAQGGKEIAVDVQINELIKRRKVVEV
jgi:hypothetical protein